MWKQCEGLAVFPSYSSIFSIFPDVSPLPYLMWAEYKDAPCSQSPHHLHRTPSSRTLGRFLYIHLRTGLHIRADTLNKLILYVQKHRKNLGQPVHTEEGQTLLSGSRTCCQPSSEPHQGTGLQVAMPVSVVPADHTTTHHCFLRSSPAIHWFSTCPG